MTNVQYGYSPVYHTEIVINDPYANATSRICIVVFIAFFSFLFATRLYIVYAISANPHGTQAVTALTFPQRRIFCILAITSMLIAGIHHIDNFTRITAYYMTPYLYHGYFFPLDIGVYYWFIASVMLAHAGETLLNHKFSDSFTRNSAFYAVYVHCTMIWLSPILHYSVEPMQSYSWIENTTICSEGMCAVVLHGYTLYLACCSAGSSSDGSNKGEYSRVQSHDIDVELATTTKAAGRTMIEDEVEDEEEEGHFEQVRRRSKDSPTIRP